jgi:hypothetical protein
MGAIDNVVAHFDAQEVNSFEVPEWGTEGKPLVIYSKPLTLYESKKLYRMSNDNDLEVMVYAIITKALDADGEKIFSLADKENLMNRADVTVVANVAGKILGAMSPSQAEEK